MNDHELLQAATEIQKLCNENVCDDCPFFWELRCILRGEYPWLWNTEQLEREE